VTDLGILLIVWTLLCVLILCVWGGMDH